MSRFRHFPALLIPPLLFVGLLPAASAGAQQMAYGPRAAASEEASCVARDLSTLRRNPSAEEMRCRFGVAGRGHFGLASFMDVPVYQPRTPLPGTHVIGVRGMPAPMPGESHDEWEWRLLRSTFGAEARRTHRGIDVLDPLFTGRLLELERLASLEGIGFVRRETWRAPERQAFLFQQGRSRPGPFLTATLTSWHCMVDERGQPAGRAADYTVAPRALERFHELAARVGLQSFGADSNDPGHVFLPPRAHVSPLDVAVLRMLPRVTEVTLATGRPADEWVMPQHLPLLRQSSVEFAQMPFVPEPAPAVTSVSSEPRLRLIRTRGSSPATPSSEKKERRGPGRQQSPALAK